MSNKKKRQHYIQKASLHSWTDINNQLCVYLKKENRIVQSSPRLVGVEKNFYSLPDINQEELDATLTLTRLVQLPDKYILDLYDLSWRKINAESAIEKRILQRVQNEVIEELYGCIESAFPRNLLLGNDLSFWKNDKKVTKACVRFLFYQLFRTKRTQDTIVDLQSMDESPLNKNIDWKKVYKYYNFVLPFAPINNLIMHIDDFILEIVSTQSELPFLIGDQPVINLAFSPQQKHQQISDMFLYYPISPTQSLCYYHKDSLIGYRGELTEEQVDQVNQTQIDTSLLQVFSNGEKILQRYIKDI